MVNIDQYLIDKITYDPESGQLIWKVDSGRFNKYKAGSLAGSVCRRRGYIIISITNGTFQKKLLGHRVAWFLYYGVWPSKVLDHKNGNPSDNRISNLREATVSQNSCNSKKRVDNTSGIKGISFNLSRNKWEVYLNHMGKKIHLGRFESLEFAKIELEKARLRIHKEFSNNG